MKEERTFNMTKFMKGASILTFAAFVVKLLSATYRVPFQNMVGDAGFYTYQQVYPLIGIFVVWTSYGVAVALSKLLADEVEMREKEALYQLARFVLFSSSFIVWAVLYTKASAIAHWMGDLKLTPLIRWTSWMALGVGPIASLKGWEQSFGSLTSIAIANVSEQFVRVTVVIVGAYVVMRANGSIYEASTVAVIGSLIGSVVAFIILRLQKRPTYRLSLPARPFNKMGKLFILSVSFSASSLILLLYQFVDSGTVFNILTTSMPIEEAMRTKGIYDRGQPFVQLGILVATTLSLAIVPLIAHYEAHEAKQQAQQYMSLTFRIAFMFGVASTVGLLLVLGPLNVALFERHEQAIALSIFMLQIVLLSLILPLTAILQGQHRIYVPLFAFMTSVGIKYVGNVMLIPIGGVRGAAVASVLSLCYVACVIVTYFYRVTQKRLATFDFYRTIVRATVSMSVAVFVYGYGFNMLCPYEQSRLVAFGLTMSAASIGAIVFGVVIMRAKVIATKEWYVLPFGRQLAKLQLWIQGGQ